MRRLYYDNNYHPGITLKKRAGNFKKRFLVLIILFLSAYLLYKGLINPKGPKSILEINVSKNPSMNAISKDEFKNSSKSLEEAVAKSLEVSTGTYAVVIKNLKTGESYSKDEHRSFEAGSLYKLWVMAETFNQLEQGKLTADQVLSADIAELNKKFDIDPELAEQTEGGITLTVANALKQMITISHNYAALLLTEKIKLSSVASFLEKNNFSGSKVGAKEVGPTTSTYDIALFYQKLYKGELSDPENTGKMINLLKGQRLNSKLPKDLPTGTVVAHKTGEIGYFSHDGGIVYTPSGDYIIVVLSKSESPKGAEDKIAKISQAVYQYFTK